MPESSMNQELRGIVESEIGSISKIEELDEGLNQIYRFSSGGSRYILKVHTNPKNKTQWFRSEPQIYEKIAVETDIPSPKIVYKDLSGDSYQDMFYVMEMIEGENPQNIREYFGQKELEKLLQQYGEILGKIHELQITDEYGIIGFEDGVFGPPDSAEQWNWALEGAMSAWREITEDEWENPPKIKFDSQKVKEKLPKKPESVLLHSDNRLDNLLVDKDMITGFLDWSHPWSGDRTYELVKTEYLLIERDIGEWDNELNLNELKEKFYSAYSQETGFQKGEEFQELRKIYRYAITLELAAGFVNWGSELDEGEYEEVRKDIVRSIKDEQPKDLVEK